MSKSLKMDKEDYPTEEKREFYEFLEKAGWNFFKETGFEWPIFCKWRQKVEEAAKEKVIIDKYCEELKVKVQEFKDEIPEMGWKPWIYHSFLTDAYSQEPPIPWEYIDQPFDIVAWICSEVYGVEVDRSQM